MSLRLSEQERWAPCDSARCGPGGSQVMLGRVACGGSLSLFQTAASCALCLPLGHGLHTRLPPPSLSKWPPGPKVSSGHLEPCRPCTGTLPCPVASGPFHPPLGSHGSLLTSIPASLNKQCPHRERLSPDPSHHFVFKALTAVFITASLLPAGQ